MSIQSSQPYGLESVPRSSKKPLDSTPQPTVALVPNELDTVELSTKPKVKQTKAVGKAPPKKKKPWRWYQKAAAFVGGTIVATPFLLLGAAHIWARLPVKTYIEADQITKLYEATINKANINPEELLALLESTHKKLTIGKLELLPQENANVFLHIMKTVLSVVKNLPSENRKQLVNYASWQLWGDLITKKQGTKEVFKNIVSAFGVPAKKNFQQLGEDMDGLTPEQIYQVAQGDTHKLKEMWLIGEPLAKLCSNLMVEFTQCAVEMRDDAPATPFKYLKAHVMETLQKINADLPKDQQYDLTPFQQGNPPLLGAASVGQVYVLGKVGQAYPEAADSVLKVFTGHPDTVPEYFTMFYDMLRHANLLKYYNFKKEPNQYMGHPPAKAFLTEVESLSKVIRHDNTTLTEDESIVKAIELYSLKEALAKTHTLKGELDVTAETEASRAMADAYEAAGHGHTFARVNQNGADYGSKILVTQQRAWGESIKSKAFSDLPIEEQLRAKIEYVKLQTLYGAFHSDLHGKNFKVQLIANDNKFDHLNVIDPGRISILGKKQIKAMNGLQLLMLLEDSSVTNPLDGFRAIRDSTFQEQAKGFRQTLFKSESLLSDPNHRFEPHENPFQLILENKDGYAEQVLSDTSYRWNASEVGNKINKYLTKTINSKHEGEEAIMAHVNKCYDEKEIIIFRKKATEIVKELQTTTGLTLDGEQERTAIKNAIKNLVTIVDTVAVKAWMRDSTTGWLASENMEQYPRYQSLGLS